MQQLTPIRIKIAGDGEIVVDDAPLTLEQFQARINACDPTKTIVWYFRENPDAATPPPTAMQVLGIVMTRRIPISLSSKPDFSDVIDDKGVSRPRQ